MPHRFRRAISFAVGLQVQGRGADADGKKKAGNASGSLIHRVLDTGSIISEAGNDPNVVALVCIAAFALDEGESCASIETAVPQASKAFKPDSNGNWWIEQDHFAANFAADISPAESHYMAISQVPISTDSFTHKVTSPAWKTKPTLYIVASSDRSINPLQERMMAKRANAKTVEVNASHVAHMSHPMETVKLTEDAATTALVN